MRYSIQSGICNLGFNLFFALSNSKLLVSMCIHRHINKQTKTCKPWIQTCNPLLHESGLPEPWVCCSFQDLPQWFTKLAWSVCHLLLYWALQLSEDVLVDAGFLCMLGEIVKERSYTSCKLLDLFSLPPRLVSKPIAHVLDKSDSCKRSPAWFVFWFRHT